MRIFNFYFCRYIFFQNILFREKRSKTNQNIELIKWASVMNSTRLPLIPSLPRLTNTKHSPVPHMINVGQTPIDVKFNVSQ